MNMGTTTQTSQVAASSETTHTPTTLLELVRARLQPTRNTVQVKGLFEPRGGKPYNGYFYDRLVEETSSQKLTLRVPELIRKELEAGEPYQFQGSVACAPNNGSEGIIEVSVTVVDYIAQERRPELVKRDLDIAALLRSKALKTSTNVDDLLRQKLYRGEKPVITLIFGATGIAENDVSRALDKAAVFYELVSQPVTLRDTKKVGEVIRLAKGDVIALFRGGGDLTSLDNLELARALLESSLPVVVALGHEADETLLDKVADKILSTPTALGTYLRDLVQESQTLDARSREKVRGELEKEFNERWQRERTLFEAKSRQHRLPTWALLIAVMLGLIAGILVTRFW